MTQRVFHAPVATHADSELAASLEAVVVRAVVGAVSESVPWILSAPSSAPPGAEDRGT
ncbi:hypothetical protein [Arthrobacter sp. H41]|uniref:hypothetical protein n=1 Tax=Arthrobacter sp. H41 TaxID=1312978 RepID=UPI0004B4BEAE|nr:hypothetical protein [Arthrobacter sp. H41]